MEGFELFEGFEGFELFEKFPLILSLFTSGRQINQL
jgi:hypothetical protein